METKTPSKYYPKTRGMNGRQKYFLQMVMERGFYVATRLAGYSKEYGYKLLRHPLAKGYQLSLLTDAMQDVNMSLGQLLKERFKLATNKENPVELRNEILKDLTNMFNDRGANIETTQMQLKPSKEIPLAEVIHDKEAS